MSKNNPSLVREVADFGIQVRQRLMMNCDTQKELAIYLGIDSSSLSRILDGKLNYGVNTYFLLRRYVNGDFTIKKDLKLYENDKRTV